MANEFGWNYGQSGQAANLYGVLRSEAGAAWDIGAQDFVALASVTWANCDFAWSEIGSTGNYQASMPTGVPTGVVILERYRLVGATPTPLDFLFDSTPGYWDGTDFRTGSMIEANQQATGVSVDAADVWNALTASHSVTGSFGEFVQGLPTTVPTANAVSAAVWSDILADYAGSTGTFGHRMNRIPSALAGTNGGLPTVDGNNRIAGIQGAVTTLDGLNDLSNSEVAAAVWGALRSSYVAAGTFGERVLADATHISGNAAAANNLEDAILGTGSAAINADVVEISGDSVAADVLEAALEMGGGAIKADMVQISGDATAADNWEAALDGTGGVTIAATITAVANAVTANVTQIEGSDATDALQSAAVAANVLHGLDHLLASSVVGADVANDSIIAQLVSSAGVGDWDTFDNSVHSLEAIAEGGGGGGGPSASAIADAVAQELVADHASVAGSFAQYLSRIPNAAPGSSGGLPTVDSQNQIAGIQGAISTFDGLENFGIADFNSRIGAYGLDHIFTQPITGSDVVNNSFAARLVSASGTADFDDFVHTSHSLQAIAEDGGGGGPSASAIADAVAEELVADHASVAGSFAQYLSRIPNAAPGTSGGLPTVDSQNQIAGIQGAISTFDGLENFGIADFNARIGAYGLDHIFTQPITGSDVVNNSFAARLVSASGTADFDDFDHQLMSLEALRDNQGTIDNSAIATAVWAAARAANNAAGSFGETLGTVETNIDNLDVAVSTRSTVTTGQVNAEVDAALADVQLHKLMANALSGGEVVDDSLIAKLVSKSTTASFADFANISHSLQALKDNMFTTANFPANFSSLVIDGSGRVDAMVQGVLDTALTEGTAGRIAGNFETFFANSDAASLKTQDDIGTNVGAASIDVATSATRLADRYIWRLGRRFEGVTARNKIVKQSGHDTGLALDFRNWLAAGEQLDTVVSVVEEGSSDLTVTPGSIVYEQVRCRISGGVNDVDYRIRFRATTTAGNTVDAEGVLAVRDT